MVDFAYTSNDHHRTAGRRAQGHAQGYGQGFKTVQAWKTKKTAPAQTAQANTAQNTIVSNLEKAAQGRVGTFDVQLETSMAYADPGARIETQGSSQNSSSYEFEDVVDVINPLHHLPVIGMIYRGLTGDTLHPMSQIIGGAIYGGPVGAVTGTINAISQVETGKDISGHMLGFAGLDSGPSIPSGDVNNPVEQLNNVARQTTENQPLEELPGSTLAFVNLAEPGRAYEKMRVADGRTAGSMLVKKQMAAYKQVNTNSISTMKASAPLPETNLDRLPQREAITTVSVSAMPEKQNI